MVNKWMKKKEKYKDVPNTFSGQIIGTFHHWPSQSPDLHPIEHFIYWRHDWRQKDLQTSSSWKQLHYRPGKVSRGEKLRIWSCSWVQDFRQSLTAKAILLIIIFFIGLVWSISYGPICRLFRGNSPHLWFSAFIGFCFVFELWLYWHVTPNCLFDNLKSLALVLFSLLLGKYPGALYLTDAATASHQPLLLFEQQLPGAENNAAETRDSKQLHKLLAINQNYETKYVTNNSTEPQETACDNFLWLCHNTC